LKAVSDMAEPPLSQHLAPNVSTQPQRNPPQPAASSRARSATLIGCGAIALWALLAALTVATGEIPPFELAAMTFAVGGGAGLVALALRPGAARALRQPPVVWLVGVGGLFGYHALYFAALRLAPPAEAGLIAYLWPLLIVLFSALLPGERLRGAHIVGTLLGLAGVVILVAGRNGGFSPEARFIPGYLLALGCAFVWSSYSVLSRLLGKVPTDAVAGFCLATSVLALICHLAFERTVWPASLGQWLAVLALGLGPVGLAFYLWDIGVKKGDLRFLGVVSYASPPLSTLILVLAGFAEAGWSLALAACLIVGGAFMAGMAGKR
jgi:drug/metabolite transporter (DMT)-like permease